jgi:Bacterial regulatory proteins, tetR family
LLHREVPGSAVSTWLPVGAGRQAYRTPGSGAERVTDEQVRTLSEVIEARVAYLAARELFQQKIYAARELGLSMDTIADSSGLDRQRLYRHFAGKSSRDAVLSTAGQKVS